MTIRASFSILFVCCCLVLVAVAADTSNVNVKIPKAKYLFGIAAAPVGKDLLVFSSIETPEGEITFGRATLVRLGAHPPLVAELVVPISTDDFTIPVWHPKGSIAYFMTSKGLYAIDLPSRKVRLVFNGSLAGLAISPDGSRLAFWNLSSDEPHHYSLVVLDLKSVNLVRKWDVERNFASDQYGFEIAFTESGNSIVAKTYDAELTTPLKYFRIDTGEIRTICPDVTSVAGSTDSIFFIAHVGEQRALMKLRDESMRAEEVIRDFPYDGLLSSGTRRWLVAKDGRTRRLATFDSWSGKLSELPGKCETAVVLSDGEVIVARRGILLDSVEACKTSAKSK